jgi:hypothetical protein
MVFQLIQHDVRSRKEEQAMIRKNNAHLSSITVAELHQNDSRT